MPEAESNNNEDTEGWDGPQSTPFPYHPIRLLNDHPLPTTEKGAKGLWEQNKQLQHDYDEPPHPDELHEEYISLIADANNWKVFKIPLIGYGMRIYFWDHLGGHGFFVDTGESQNKMIAEAFIASAIEDNSMSISEILESHQTPE